MTVYNLFGVIKMKLIATLLLFLYISCGNEKGKRAEIEKDGSGNEWSISSTNNWVKNKGLLNIESIVYDEANGCFYSTNGTDYSLGTNGFISKISDNGNLLDLKWIKNLNRPTGMAIHDSLLYVADINSLIVINTRSGKVLDNYLEPIANSGLNDVSINKNGEVYVTASFIHSIFKLVGGKLIVWNQDEEKLKWANGLLATNTELLVAGLHINTINIGSKSIAQFKLKPPVKDFEGIVSDGLTGYFLTTVENSGLFYLNEHGRINKLMEGNDYFGDLEFDSSLKKLYIPRGNKNSNEFFITVLTMNRMTDQNKRQ